MATRKLAMLAASMLLVPSVTLAIPIQVDFTITAAGADFTEGAGEEVRDIYNGYPVGTVGSGSFIFDDAVGEFLETVDGLVATDLQFSWLGRSWDESNARIFGLSFDASGSLRTWGIGAWIPDYDCDLGCVSSVGGPTTDFSAFESGFGAVGFLHEPSVRGWMRGGIEWSSRPASVLEPSTFALLALGLFASSMRRWTPSDSSKVGFE